jgi:superfamily II DNA/RNA helicase
VRPILDFNQVILDPSILSVIKSREYVKPTPIQSQAIPIGLCGFDMIGVAKTG